jgi:hypothetical protein
LISCVKFSAINAAPLLLSFETKLMSELGHFDRDEASGRSRHVGYARESGNEIKVFASAAMGLGGLMASPGA